MVAAKHQSAEIQKSHKMAGKPHEFHPVVAHALHSLMDPRIKTGRNEAEKLDLKRSQLRKNSSKDDESKQQQPPETVRPERERRSSFCLFMRTLEQSSGE
ncbi:hypothetical protein GUJ93_ZPchr0012g21764 [Zizania palustris]|uniref:Uncharacterized protein n=1 Tax=Zizania palustris TaxID=103762 RepID=A0A8J5WP16_ZIZPA|nr:hypothetical protein GUJ93_ZPchr0012g21764 [Zizania palustris]